MLTRVEILDKNNLIQYFYLFSLIVIFPLGSKIQLNSCCNNHKKFNVSTTTSNLLTQEMVT